MESKLQNNIHGPASAVLKAHEKHISAVKPDFTFPPTCADRSLSVQASAAWTLRSSLNHVDSFVSAMQRAKETCFWTGGMDLAADHSVNVTSLTVVVVAVVFCLYVFAVAEWFLWLLLMLLLHSFVWADHHLFVRKAASSPALDQLHYLWCSELIKRWNSWWVQCWCCSVKLLVKLYLFL